ncbi:helix-turn-helix domain-containing protein [Ligilactobacillus ruminis]|uniref:helix-turn-helix domain-containing protein n=1 Tax=Ligilactobacillus ruminis TaxID=1623 RepID=UPI0022E424BB|nr:helix-turn-helix transcriptional regulator [Ligilactobacillus ruminis]
MRISYNRLWKLLIDKNLKKKDLMERWSISSASVAKLTKGDNITTDVLLRICEGLDCDFADIMQVIPDEEPGEKET